MTDRKKPFSGSVELSPPVRRFPEWPPDYNIPSVINESSVYLEVGASAGHRDNWYSFAAIFLFSGISIIVIFKIMGAPWSIQLLYMAAPFFALSLFCLMGTALTPAALPLRVNRETQELLFMHNHRLYKAPWQNFRAQIDFAPSTVATGVYILWFILHREGDQKPLSVAVGGGRSQEHALRHWEYFCLYMENGTPVPILEDVPEDQKSNVRKNWEKPMARLLGKHASYILFPLDFLENNFQKLSLRPNRWPEEVIAVCEKHPILQTPEGRASIITDPRAKLLQAKEERETQTRAAQPRTRVKNWVEVEKRGDFED